MGFKIGFRGRVSIRLAEPDKFEDIQAICTWANDPAIRHLYQISRTEADLKKYIPQEHFKERLKEVQGRGRELYLMQIGKQVVGSVSLAINAPELIRSPELSVWFGLVIGSANFRGRGLGKQAMRFIERRAQELEASRAEIGVFEYNEGAQRFYRTLGYNDFACHTDVTWWDGRLRGDIRMEKNLI